MGVGRRIRGLGFVRVPEFGYTQMYPETNPILDTQALILSGYATLHPETSSMLLFTQAFISSAYTTTCTETSLIQMSTHSRRPLLFFAARRDELDLRAGQCPSQSVLGA